MPRPNPTQTKNLDNVTIRRELKQLLPSTVILDQAEARELLDLSNQSARHNALRLKLLARAISQLAAGDMLRPDQFDALLAFHQGHGPRPDFARFVTADGHYGQAALAPDDRDAPKAGAPGPVEDPSEPGRYVQPKGRFALAGKDDRWAE